MDFDVVFVGTLKAGHVSLLGQDVNGDFRIDTGNLVLYWLQRALNHIRLFAARNEAYQ